ncbi:MAG TPA: PEGA domain-containing protein [Candidatus Polarisedimenticolaceae bacterium]|nr:PEGA domain-containing protein [Candidatus Polarisedimenticolaceae bacterium]
MSTRARFLFRIGVAIAATLAVGIPALAQNRHAVPRSSAHSAPVRAARPSAARGAVAPRGTANGTARYGYHGGGVVGGYPGWGWCAPYYGWGWGWGWGGWWGWGWPGYGYGYAPYGPAYVYAGDGPQVHVPAAVETDVTPAKAEVWLDGESVGFARDYDGRWDTLSIPAGHHVLEFRKSGFRTLVVEVDARPGARYVFDDVLAEGEGEERRTIAASEKPSGGGEPSGGRLTVHADPADTAIYLDGEYLGLASELSRLHGPIAIAQGSHRVEAVRPGYASAARTVEVGADGTAVVEFTLERAR